MITPTPLCEAQPEMPVEGMASHRHAPNPFDGSGGLAWEFDDDGVNGSAGSVVLVAEVVPEGTPHIPPVAEGVSGEEACRASLASPLGPAGEDALGVGDGLTDLGDDGPPTGAPRVSLEVRLVWVDLVSPFTTTGASCGPLLWGVNTRVTGRGVDRSPPLSLSRRE